MLLAALSEAAILIARAEDPPAALAAGQAAVGTLVDRLALPRRRNDSERTTPR
jgi:hypothetical protein